MNGTKMTFSSDDFDAKRQQLQESARGRFPRVVVETSANAEGLEEKVRLQGGGPGTQNRAKQLEARGAKTEELQKTLAARRAAGFMAPPRQTAATVTDAEREAALAELLAEEGRGKASAARATRRGR